MRSLFYFSILPSACALQAAQVAVKDDGKAFTLSNGYVTAVIGYAGGKPMSGMICYLESRHSMGRAGTVTGLVYNATINRDGIAGSWVEKDLVFDAGLLKAGENVMTLTIPAGGWTSGIIHDSIRLEVQ